MIKGETLKMEGLLNLEKYIILRPVKHRLNI